jgi:hypothetical protein
MEIATKPLIMASEISGLEPLRALIKQENQVAPVHFQLAKKRHGNRCPVAVVQRVEKADCRAGFHLGSRSGPRNISS